MEVTADSNYRHKEKVVNVYTRYITEVKRVCRLEMGENYHKSQM